MTKKQRGGTRPGAGRKPLDGKNRSSTVSFRLNEEERRRYMQLGSGAWVRPFLDQPNTVRAKPAPPGPTSVVSLTLTAKQRSTWFFRGGGKWLRALLKEHA